MRRPRVSCRTTTRAYPPRSLCPPTPRATRPSRLPRTRVCPSRRSRTPATRARRTFIMGTTRLSTPSSSVATSTTLSTPTSATLPAPLATSRPLLTTTASSLRTSLTTRPRTRPSLCAPSPTRSSSTVTLTAWTLSMTLVTSRVRRATDPSHRLSRVFSPRRWTRYPSRIFHTPSLRRPDCARLIPWARAPRRSSTTAPSRPRTLTSLRSPITRAQRVSRPSWLTSASRASCSPPR
mmetsp:Transcript_27510/g.55359  ORF Transcript_27510/g.55359 Transcript_27510/m.55359 type:complete len:236 (-) Transcript_27510:1635-2342(-)